MGIGKRNQKIKDMENELKSLCAFADMGMPDEMEKEFRYMEDQFRPSSGKYPLLYLEWVEKKLEPAREAAREEALKEFLARRRAEGWTPDQMDAEMKELKKIGSLEELKTTLADRLHPLSRLFLAKYWIDNP